MNIARFHHPNMKLWNVFICLCLLTLNLGAVASAEAMTTKVEVDQGAETNEPPQITEGDQVDVTMSVNGVPEPFLLSLHATDPDDDSLTWRISVPAPNGNASTSGTGTNQEINYTPNTDYLGVDSFTVEVSDEHGGTDSTVVHVIITSTPDVPAQEVVTPTPEEPEIVGGAPADPGEYPWQVALVDGISTNLRETQFCGGSLVAPQWVLTAAHCITGTGGSIVPVGSLDVVAGIYNLATPAAGYQRRDVIQIIRHPSYVAATLDNDLALLKLNSPVTIGGSGETKTAVIPLVPANIGDLTGVNAWVTGWGNTESTPAYPDQLHEVQLPIIANSICNDAIHWDGIITANKLCAGYDAGGYSACSGDSGGPLVVLSSGQWMLAGIVSSGNVGNCDAPYKPSVYTRVSQYVSWINSNVSTPHCGTINSNETWSGGGNVHVVSCDVTVASGVTLTISQGAIVKFELGKSLIIQGTLRVLGASGNPVYLTSIREDIGGDTNGDGGATVPQPGNWSRIEFQNSSNDATSLIDNAVICYGSTWYNGAVELVSASPTVQNTTFCNNWLHAILADVNSVPKLTNNTFVNNGTNGFTYRGGTISNDTTWNMTDTSYFILDNVSVGVGKTLTINPGVVVKFEDNRALIIQGALRVLGTSEAKAYFTSKRDDTVGDPGDTNNDGATLPQPGNWSRIEFQDSSNDANSLINYAVIRYGGGCCSYGGITLVSASPAIQKSTITNNYYYGISTSNSTPVLGCNDIYDNGTWSGGKRYYGLYNATPAAMVNAENQWWGSASGPYHPTLNPGGTGNAVSDGVDFSPWANQPCDSPPSPFSKSSPSDGATNQPVNPTLIWEASVGAASYEYCLDTTINDACNGSWVSNGTSTSKSLTGLSLGTPYEWHVRAVNAGGTTYSNNSTTAFWTFITEVAGAAHIDVTIGGDLMGS